MGTATRKRIYASEREMHAEWAGTAGSSFEAAGGMRIRVVYPGIPLGSAGPDFKDAIVDLSGGGTVHGDVELHLHADDWRRHGHHLDHAYDHVVLHVVGDASPGVGTMLADGREVLTISMAGRTRAQQSAGMPCGNRGELDCGDAAADTLRRLGVARLLQRAAGLAGELVREQPWVVLARRTARGLGYSANAGVAMELAVRLTLRGAPALHEVDDAGERCALMLGAAGLLPSQRRLAGVPVQGEAPLWESCWRQLRFGVEPLDPRSWRLSGLYPNNSPVRRIVALSWLWPDLPRLAASVAGLADAAPDQPGRSADVLEKLCRVPGDAFWHCHYDFGLRTGESDVVGASKARELVVNALLPYAAAVAIVSGDASRLSSVVRLLCGYPSAADNAVTRHMRRQLRLAQSGGGAAVQQGMLHLFHQFCSRGLCDACPLGREPLPAAPAALWASGGSRTGACASSPRAGDTAPRWC